MPLRNQRGQSGARANISLNTGEGLIIILQNLVTYKCENTSQSKERVVCTVSTITSIAESLV
jgi:hypothetical protein